jgi:hypothetical protein
MDMGCILTKKRKEYKSPLHIGASSEFANWMVSLRRRGVEKSRMVCTSFCKAACHNFSWEVLIIADSKVFYKKKTSLTNLNNSLY